MQEFTEEQYFALFEYVENNTEFVREVCNMTALEFRNDAANNLIEMTPAEAQGTQETYREILELMDEENGG